MVLSRCSSRGEPEDNDVHKMDPNRTTEVTNVFKKFKIQECIPVGCVPSAAVAISPGACVE